jgi:acyl-CoA thioester hydrolase
MWYTGKFDEASWALLSRLGLTQIRLRQSERAMAAVQQNITYKRELYAGDVVTIRSRIIEFRSKVIRLVHEMINDATGEVAAVADLTGVHMNALTRKATEFPDHIFQELDRLSVIPETEFEQPGVN